jgi:hypothetical protein
MMTSPGRWVLLAYRLPREPSTPRIAIWRKLKRLGVVQLLDGLVALPLDSRNREQLEWLAEEILQAGGETSTWLADPTTGAQDRDLAQRLRTAIGAEYAAVTAEARSAAAEAAGTRRRTLARLRRELDRIRRRDYFAAPERDEARRAVQELRETIVEAAA